MVGSGLNRRLSPARAASTPASLISYGGGRGFRTLRQGVGRWSAGRGASSIGTMDTQPLRTDRPSGQPAPCTGRRPQASQAYHLSFTIRGGEPLFQDFTAACTMATCLHDCTLAAGGRMLAWVVMPESVHCLFHLGGQRSLRAAATAFKSSSARRVNRALGRTGPLWDRAWDAHALDAGDDLRSVARCIVANPLRAGLVRRIADYPFWNAIWLGDADAA